MWRDQRGVGGGDGINAASYVQNFRCELDRVRKIAGNLSERGHKQVAEVVPLECVAAAKPMGEQLGQQVFFFAERDHAVAQVAGRKHVEALAQAAGGTAVVGHCDHRGQVGDESRLGRRMGRALHARAVRATAWKARCRRRWRPRAWPLPALRLAPQLADAAAHFRYQALEISKQALRNLRIQQFGKAGIVHHALESRCRRAPAAGFWDSVRWLGQGWRDNPARGR
jgi:hypothetical protein